MISNSNANLLILSTLKILMLYHVLYSQVHENPKMNIFSKAERIEIMCAKFTRRTPRYTYVYVGTVTLVGLNGLNSIS